MIKNFVVAMVVLGSTLAAIAGHAQMVPAQFGSSRQDFIDRLALPELATGDEILLRCGANVYPNGEMREIACLESVENVQAFRALVRDISRVSRFVRISPAQVDNKPELVWMNFALRVRQSDMGPEVEIFEHHLMNVDRLGMDYVSAQRFDKGSWGCRNVAKGVELLRARVDAAGQVHDVQVSTIRITEDCANQISQAASSSRYIPATVNGTPVDSMYFEMFYWR